MPTVPGTNRHVRYLGHGDDGDDCVPVQEAQEYADTTFHMTRLPSSARWAGRAVS